MAAEAAFGGGPASASVPSSASNGWSWRAWHGTAALAVLFPLLLTAGTGAVYRIARKVFAYESKQVGWLLDWHTLSSVGLGRIYPVMLGGALCALLLSGLALLLRSIEYVGVAGIFSQVVRNGGRGDALAGLNGRVVALLDRPTAADAD